MGEWIVPANQYLSNDGTIPAAASFQTGGCSREFLMLIVQIAGGIAACLFLAAVMTGIEGNEHW